MDAVPYATLLIEKQGRVGIITLNRPKVLNACNSPMHRELQRAIEAFEGDDGIGAVIIRGAGRAFCSGSDLSETRQYQGRSARQYIKLDFSTKNRIAACAKPVIAAVHGHAAGGGFELALACDIRIVADDVQFSLPEVKIGTIPGAGGLQRLPAIVGQGIALEWALSSRVVAAAEALRTGLANAVVPVAGLLDAALELAARLAERNPLALALAKAALVPEPPAQDGLVGAYHMLASEACHYERQFHSSTDKYGDGSTDGENAPPGPGQR